MNIKTCAVYNNDATVVGIYFSPLLPRVNLPSVLRGWSQLQMGQVASAKLRKFVACSSSASLTEEEQEEFRPHHPTFVVTAEVPNSKPASLQPNRYSESNRSFQSLAKDSFVLDLVSSPPRTTSRPRHGLRRAVVPEADYPILIAKRFDSVSQHHCLLHLLHRHLHHHLPLLPLQWKDIPSPPSTRHSSSMLSTSLSKNSARVPTDVSSLLNTVDLERVVRSRKSPTSTQSAF